MSKKMEATTHHPPTNQRHGYVLMSCVPTTVFCFVLFFLSRYCTAASLYC